ncbi:hypothetical protein EVAR_92427_1 [Eumeta japonica]|uniref:Uncharacterized protein n=1 Tax=Eumeta variegata TaxID=151549 RepID=A0A4C1T6W2_EUMVA|nr:hypothetical protein EVAR_92427_1 [Eumeta japonica]
MLNNEARTRRSNAKPGLAAPDEAPELPIDPISPPSPYVTQRPGDRRRAEFVSLLHSRITSTKRNQHKLILGVHAQKLGSRNVCGDKVDDICKLTKDRRLDIICVNETLEWDPLRLIGLTLTRSMRM